MSDQDLNKPIEETPAETILTGEIVEHDTAPEWPQAEHPLRIAWYSNAPWCATGYGNQTRLFIERLEKIGHKTAVLSNWGLEGGVINWNGIPVYPKGYSSAGLDAVAAHARHFQADLMLLLYDSWVYVPEQFKDVKWVPWFPVDHEPIPRKVVQSVQHAYARIVYSKWALQQVNDAGLDAEYVPHGIDTNNFKPDPDRERLREDLGLNDKFVVGVVAANKGFAPSRKSWPQLMQAFAEFSRKRKDAHLHLHTALNTAQETGGVNLQPIIDEFGISDRVTVSDPYATLVGVSPVAMAQMYSTFDVLLNPAMGEGFGLPIVEAQACGVPVITGDWTAMSELTFAGYKIPKTFAEPFRTALDSYQFLPRIGAITNALEWAYKKLPAGFREKAARGAQEYDADKVTREHWLPVLNKIGGWLK